MQCEFLGFTQCPNFSEIGDWKMVGLFFSLCAGKKVKLRPAAEEVALFFAQMLDHEYTTKKVFRENFFKDWRKVRQERRP